MNTDYKIKRKIFHHSNLILNLELILLPVLYLQYVIAIDRLVNIIFPRDKSLTCTIIILTSFW